MPGMTGVQLAEEFTKQSIILPVIIATGYAELKEDINRKFHKLSKPFSEEDLAAAIFRRLCPQTNECISAQISWWKIEYCRGRHRRRGIRPASTGPDHGQGGHRWAALDPEKLYYSAGCETDIPPDVGLSVLQGGQSWLPGQWRPSMCDYSLESVASRPAKVGDKLISASFRTREPADSQLSVSRKSRSACCGTELSFDKASRV